MRIVYYLLGFVFLSFGIIGIFLPILPTTPFVLLAAYCFSRSSERMHDWLLNNRLFGSAIAQWQVHRSMTARTKRYALILTIISFSITLIFFVERLYIRLLLLLIAMVLIILLIRIPVHQCHHHIAEWWWHQEMIWLKNIEWTSINVRMVFFRPSYSLQDSILFWDVRGHTVK